MPGLQNTNLQVMDSSTNVITLEGNVYSDLPRTIERAVQLNIALTTENVRKVCSSLTERDQKSLMFLLRSDPRLGLDFITTYNNIHQDPYLLAELLYTIKRFDLLKVIGTCAHQISKLCKLARNIDKFWLLLFNVCETLTVDEIGNRFQYQEDFILSLYTNNGITESNVNLLIVELRKLPTDEVQETLKQLESYQKRIDDNYPMNTIPTGLCIILNMEKFDDPLLDRPGSSIDVERLRKTFNTFGFVVMVRNNLSYDEVVQLLEKAAHYDHSRFSCFVLCFLSHGDEYVTGKAGSVVTTRDGKVLSVEKDIAKRFDSNNSPTLDGKPKVLILQACRGAEEMLPSGFRIPALSPEVVDVSPDHDGTESAASFLPDDVSADDLSRRSGAAGGDIVLCFASQPGYKSYRSDTFGSWFIKTLCQFLEKYGETEDFTRTFRRVTKFISYCGETNSGFKQVPRCEESLCRDLQFRRVAFDHVTLEQTIFSEF